jgi:hypothetical protein
MRDFFLQFIFKYKPRVILEAEGTIVREPTHPHAIHEKDEDEEDEEQETERKPCPKRVKSEPHNADDKLNNRQDKKPKMIDLTGLGDSD